MAQMPEPRLCPQCSARAYHESFFCNLYVDGKDWVKPTHGDLHAAITTIKSGMPRNPFQDRGQVVA
eukprot:1464916-Lingulodinium_polyedra.AAC.1